MKHIFKLTLRKLTRKRFYVFLNILGLSIGFACCLLIYLFIQEELRYDSFHKELDQLYRVNQTNIWVDDGIPFGSTGPGVAYSFQEIPEVEQIIRLHTPGEAWVSFRKTNGEGSVFQESLIVAADSNFFDFFSFPLLKGEQSNILDEPNSVLLSPQTAERYFGEENPIGKTLHVDFGYTEKDVLVRGVVDNLSNQTHIQFDMLLSMNTFPTVKERSWSWIWTTFITYIKLNPGISPESLQEKINGLPRKYAVQTLKWTMGVDSFDDFEAQGKVWELFLQPVKDIHLRSGAISNRLGAISDIRYIYAFSATALLILLLSCINYMNLATARSIEQTREVGVQKILGVPKGHLFSQFVLESLLISLFSLILGIGLADLLLIPFNELAQKSLSFSIWENWQEILGFFFLSIVVGVITGSFPARYLSKTEPVASLKGKLLPTGKSPMLQNGLVTFQFLISICLMICTSLVYKQLRYASEMELGFKREGLLVVYDAEKAGSQLDVLIDQYEQISAIQHVGFSDASPPLVFNSDYFEPLNSSAPELPLAYIHADESYLPALGIDLLAGRNFSEEFGTENQNVIINETAAMAMGWLDSSRTNWEEIIGKQISYSSGQRNTYTVIGVVQDFNFWSLQSTIEPLALFYQGSGIFTHSHRFLSLRLSPQRSEDLPLTLSKVEGLWNRLETGVPFRYSFLDEDFDRTFLQEGQLGKVLGIFSSLALFIACLGLFGLSAFSMEQRSKEIGIRKILGASFGNILQLLGKKYVPIVGIAFLFAAPLAYIVMSRWLQDYAYRTPLGWEVFLISGLVALAIAWLTISYFAVKVAMTLPIHSLRDE